MSSRLFVALAGRLLRKVAESGGMRKDGEAPPPEPVALGQIAGIILAAAAITNLAFYFLSSLYFEDRTAIYGAVTPGHITDVRLTFALFTGTVAGASILAAWQPTLIGHLIAALTAIAAMVAGISAAIHNMTPVLPASLIVSSLALTLLIWKSLERVRGAWAFLIGMTSVFSAVLLFGATKVRGVLDVGLWTALIIPGLLAVATIALSLVRDDYRDA